MKIRQGFVSNSSSSSFILLFNKKIKTKKDVYNMLFEGEMGTENFKKACHTLSSEMTPELLSKIVFNKISTDNKGLNPAGKDTLVELLSSRYYILDYKSDVRPAKEFCNQRYFYCLNEELTQKWIDLHKKQDDLHKEFCSRERIFFSKVKEVRFNEAGYDEYIAQIEEIKKTKEYKKFDKDYCKKNEAIWAKIAKVTREIAAYDLERFMALYKNPYAYIVSFTDNGGEKYEAWIEHCGILESEPTTLRISFH